MKVHNGLEGFPKLSNVILTMGTFDGVHYGHRKILKRLLDTAKQNSGCSVVMTFDPHPRSVLFPHQKDLRLLSTISEKVDLMNSIGIDHLVIQPFTIPFSQLSHAEFVKSYLVDKIGIHKMVVGYDHQFGRNRQGNFDELLKLSMQYNFEGEKIPEQEVKEVVVSSTKIRNALSSGNIAHANQLLSYYYSLSGEVVSGEQIGRTLGFPTANIMMEDSFKLIPSDGVYSCFVTLNKQRMKGVVSVGNRPTFNDSKKSIEVHLLDFNSDIYGETIKIEFVDFIRFQKKFDQLSELVNQIKADILVASEQLL